MKTCITTLFLLLFLGCNNQEELYCSEGLHQPDGLHIYHSELPEAEGAVIPFDPDRRFEFYVVQISACSSGFCIESHELGDLFFTGNSYILTNGCHTK